MPECSSPRCLPATRPTQRSRPLVEAARRGVLSACATTGILSEVYAALTWQHAQPPHSPEQAAQAVRLLVEPPSTIRVLPEEGAQEKAMNTMQIQMPHSARLNAGIHPRRSSGEAC